MSELIPIEHAYGTRLKDRTAVIPRVEKTIAQRAYYYLAPKIFNQLPNEIKLLNSESMYKKRVRQWINSKGRLEIHSMVDLKNTY